MLPQETALDHLTTYRSAYAGVYRDGVATPQSAHLHTPERRRTADRAAVSLVNACRGLAISLARNHACSLDDDTIDSLLYEAIFVRSFAYDPSRGATFTSWLGRVLRNAYTDELRRISRGRGDEHTVVLSASPLGDDTSRSLFDQPESEFASTTAGSGDAEVRGAIPAILDEVRSRAEQRDLDADLIARITAAYLLSRFDGHKRSRAEIAEIEGLSAWETRAVTNDAAAILRAVLSNQPEQDRKTA